MRPPKESLKKWSLNTDGLLTQVWLLKALVSERQIGRLNACKLFNMSISFHENRTFLKIEGKVVEKTIKTINFSYFIIKFKIPVY